MGETRTRNHSPSSTQKDPAITPELVVLKFVETINAADSKTLIKLQTVDFTLIDMEGQVFCGRDGWETYFASYPQYKIHVQKILKSGSGVAIIGRTTGSHLSPALEKKETVLWTAEVRNRCVSRWRIYSDIKEPEKGE